MSCRQLSFSNALYTSKEKLSGWGDDSVHEALSVQAGAPEFDLKSSHLFLGTVMCACNLSAGSRDGQILGWTVAEDRRHLMSTPGFHMCVYRHMNK